ncbi:hypothetical protein O6H91_11G022100 [Diphasiastrum complanatum]|uniref:Uncharacterized protein n=1 Tax=Diphasiastrum complanatum TaxID=34168 RepID=A0ACC2C7E9_DIPCM|nr:hypothetical protein O6H91_11G022100 [Diphasiastrum complanatum]
MRALYITLLPQCPHTPGRAAPLLIGRLPLKSVTLSRNLNTAYCFSKQNHHVHWKRGRKTVLVQRQQNFGFSWRIASGKPQRLHTLPAKCGLASGEGLCSSASDACTEDTAKFTRFLPSSDHSRSDWDCTKDGAQFMRFSPFSDSSRSGWDCTEDRAQVLKCSRFSDHSRSGFARALLHQKQQLIKDFGKFVSALFLLLALSLAPHRVLCEAAVAAPKGRAASSSSREQIQKQEGGDKEAAAVENQVQIDGSSPKDRASEVQSGNAGAVAEAEDEIYRFDEYNDFLDTSVLEGISSKIEAEKAERERRFEDALGAKRRVKELEAFMLEGFKSESALGQKVEEEKQAIVAEGRRLQGKVLLEMEVAVTSLKGEEAELASRADRAYKEYENLKGTMEKLAQKEGKQTQKEVLESKLKDLQRSIKELSENLSRVKTEIFAMKLEGWKAATEDVVSALDRSLTAIEEFWQQWKQRAGGRSTKYSKESKTLSNELAVVKRFSEAGKKMWEQTILPLAVGVHDTTETLDEGTRKLVEDIKLEAEKSKRLQETVDELIRDQMKSVGEEKLELMRTPEELVAKGFSPAEVKWMFGDEEVNVPGIAPLGTALGWKKWRQDKKAELKQYLLKNPEIGKQYVAEKQEQILKARDRVLAHTWFDEWNNRWEISPLGASYAATKLLVESARVRHDRRVMYLRLKGEEHEYFLNVQTYDEIFDNWGGFDALYLKMTTSGVPVTVERMPILFSEWEIEQQLQLPFKAIWWLLQKVWDLDLVRTIKPLYLKVFSQALEELMVRLVFPLSNRFLPQKAKVFLKLELPEAAEAAEPTEVMMWKQEAQKKVDARVETGNGPIPWWMALAVRCYVVGAPVVIALPWVAKVLFYPFQAKPLGPNEVEWKRKKVEKLQKRLEPGMKQQRVDPVKTLFDRMKRVKQPQVSLKDFAGIETVKEEVNEVITFLKNPNAFKEIGARPPRGVLIVGESGTGKTTLAMAIAAEAKVPLVEVQGAELEGGAWVGQGASNVRELFKTARELAPLIIFMDDFDHFAGIRGTTSDKSSQEHESLINQLLVELDGFETQEGVVMIATTSKPWTIDEALRRPGRMDRTIMLPSPNRREREQILKKVAEETMDKMLVNHVNWAVVAEKTAGLAPSQLKYVPQALESNALTGKITDEEELFSVYGWLATVNSITPKWIQKLSWVQNWEKGLIDWLGLKVTKGDLEMAVETMDAYGQTKTGLEVRDPPYVWTREGKFPHAVWAAGRGLVALLLPDFDVVDHIWLDPTSWEGIGFTSLTQKFDEGYQETGTLTRTYYEKQLVLCFGSYVASQLLLPYGENNNLSRFEIEEAQEIAANMVLQYGWGPDDSPMIYCAEGSEGAMSMGQSYEFEVGGKVKKLYLAGYNKALKMLQQNLKVLEALVEHLLESNVLSRKDMANILLEKGAIFEKEPFSLVTYSRATVVGC